MSKVPEPWASRLIERGYTDRRSTAANTASLSALAFELGVNTSTVSEAITGKRKPRPETVAALVRALGDDVLPWLELDHFESWNPPAESALLTPPQREVLEALIRVMTSEREAGTRHVATPAEKSNVREVRFGGHEPAEASGPPVPADAAAESTPGTPSQYAQETSDQDAAGEENQDEDDGGRT